MTSSKKNVTEIKGTAFFDLFLKELKEMYWTETKLVTNLPDLCNAASAEDLVHCLENHHRETIGHMDRLETIFDQLNELPSSSANQAIEGLLEEAREMLRDTEEESAVKDAGIIIVTQKIEHYEISSYGSLLALAKKLGLHDCMKMLRETLEEEKRADKMLTQVAEGHINTSALAEGQSAKVRRSGGREYPPGS